MRRVLVVGALIGLVACGSEAAPRAVSHGQTTAVPAAVVPEAATTEPATTVVPTPTTAVPIATTTVAPATTVAPTPTTVAPATTVAPTPTTAVPIATTTLPSTTTVATEPVAGGTGELLAIDVLAFVPVENEHRGGYVRDLFGYPADLDGDGCDTRAEVLQLESMTPAQVDPFGCVVVQGDWLSPYDGLTTTSPGDLEIDHVVALKEAWDSGAWNWGTAALVAYANDVSDPRALRAVSTATNRSKGDKDPSNWLPPDAADVCPFIADWVAIKARWGLSMDQSEYGRIRNLLNGPCEGWRMAALEPLPVSLSVSPTVASPVPVAAEVYYPNCAAARAAGAAPLHTGAPGYRTGLDGDKDGIACE